MLSDKKIKCVVPLSSCTETLSLLQRTWVQLPAWGPLLPVTPAQKSCKGAAQVVEWLERMPETQWTLVCILLEDLYCMTAPPPPSDLATVK